jgi:hypothetical protein
LARATRNAEVVTWDGEVDELGEGEIPTTAAEAAAYFAAQREQSGPSA